MDIYQGFHILQQIVEDEATDKRYRALALRYTKKLQEMKKTGFDKYIRGDIIKIPGAVISSDLKDMSIIIALEDYRPTPNTIAAKGVYKKTGQSIIVIYTLNTYILWNHAWDGLLLPTDSIVHEFIHLLDENRIGKPLPSVGDDGKIQSLETYYNHPLEFNAFYQAAISEMEQSLNDIESKRPKYFDIITQTWEAFEKFVMLKLDQSFVNSLNSTYRKKLKSRLYRFYKTLRG